MGNGLVILTSPVNPDPDHGIGFSRSWFKMDIGSAPIVSINYHLINKLNNSAIILGYKFKVIIFFFA